MPRFDTTISLSDRRTHTEMPLILETCWQSKADAHTCVCAQDTMEMTRTSLRTPPPTPSNKGLPPAWPDKVKHCMNVLSHAKMVVPAISAPHLSKKRFDFPVAFSMQMFDLFFTTFSDIFIAHILALLCLHNFLHDTSTSAYLLAHFALMSSHGF